MATTTFAPTAATAESVPGGVPVFGRRGRDADLLALLVLLCAALVGLTASYVRAPAVAIGVDGRYNRPYLQDFHEPEAVDQDAPPSYRWTRAASTVLAPGLGRGLWTTDLTLSSPEAAGRPKLATIETAVREMAVPLTATPRVYHLLTPSRGDLSVTIQSDAARVGADPRPLGVVFGGAAFAPVRVSPLPPALFLLYTLLALTIAFATLRLIGLAPWLALAGPLAALGLLLAAVATNRAPLGLLLPRLVLLALVGLVATGVLIWAWRALVRLGGLDPAPWLLPALLTIFYLGFWIKAGGLLYPYSHSIDVAWHMQRTREILGGRLLELYRPGAFSESVMPVNEWGNNRPVIPYSPFFHIFAAAFAIFPWRLETTANVFAVLIDTNRVILIAALALAFGLKSRGALLAALLYAITPFTFLLHSWGNIPTTFGIWWTLLSTTLMVLTFGRWRERRIFALLTLSLLGTFLFYTVMAVFMVALLGLIWIGLRIWGRGLAPGQATALLGASALAFGLSVAIYYGQYIPAIVERTLPYVTQTVVRGETNEGQSEHQTLSEYFGFYVPHLGYTNYPVRYGMWVPVLLGLPALWLFRGNRLALIILGAWYLVGLLFLILGLRVSMVDKHVFFAAPALAIACAALFERLWGDEPLPRTATEAAQPLRGRLERYWSREMLVRGAIVALYALTLLSAIDIWILRLQRVGL